MVIDDIAEAIHEIETGIIQIKTTQPITRNDLQQYTQSVSVTLGSETVAIVGITYTPSTQQPAVSKVYDPTYGEVPGIGSGNYWVVNVTNGNAYTQSIPIYCVSTQKGNFQASIISTAPYISPAADPVNNGNAGVGGGDNPGGSGSGDVEDDPSRWDPKK